MNTWIQTRILVSQFPPAHLNELILQSRDDPPAVYLSCSISQSPAFSWGRSELTDRKRWVVPPVLFRTNYYSIEILHCVTAIILTYKQFTVIAKTKLWDTCTMQLQIYIIFEKLWHKMSFKQRLKSSYTMRRFEFSWKMIPESRSCDRKRPITPGPFWSWFL